MQSYKKACELHLPPFDLDSSLKPNYSVKMRDFLVPREKRQNPKNSRKNFKNVIGIFVLKGLGLLF